MPLDAADRPYDRAGRPLDMAEQARRLREAGEMLRGQHPDHAAACVFAAVILEGESGLDTFRR